MGCNDPFEAGSVAVQTKNFTENWCWKAKGEIEGDKGVIRGGAHVCRCMVLYSKVIDYFGHAMLLQRRRLLQSGYDYVRTISDLVILHSETGQLRKTMNIWQLYIINRPYCVSYQVKQYEEAHRLLSTALSDLKDEEPFNYTGYATSLDLMGILKLHSNHPELILSLDIVEKLSQINSPVTVVH
ncbi:unnamed protein product [Rotaria magnacalcarata]|uniref:Uncharacterized protein n=1 Tax=Rotaria magnacalcarata TaxID=392030 RepID=A0A815PZH1_9BILA|nr:unnamed protein product [Rotaria magnacalcarata]